MPKTREQKEASVAELTDQLKRIQLGVMTNYHGLTVREAEELRSTLREQGMTFEVVKNTLFNRAAEAAGLKIEKIEGPVGLALGFDDAVATAKAVNTFSKDHEALEITGGISEGAQVDVSLVKQLAALPSREELLGRLVGSLSAPARNLAGVLGATTRNLVYALQAVKEQKT